MSPSSARVAADPFAKGNVRLSLTAGWGQTFDDSYMIVGGGLSYYLRRGLDAGLDFEQWFFGEPGVSKLSPQIRYTASLPMGVAPYVGGYYRRTFIEGQDDLNSIGGRAGAYKSTRGRSTFGGGFVYEKYLDCNESAYNSCSDVYPEILFTTSF